MSENVLDLTRQSGIISSELVAQAHITIVGAGAIGSHLAECLVKMGISTLTVYDDDTVEKHNLPNQGYRLNDIGLLKVEALKRNLEEGWGCTVNAIPEKVDAKTTLVTDIVISAVDSMAARAVVLEAAEESDDPIVFIDPRMGAQYGEVHVVDLLDMEVIAGYKSSIIPDRETYQVPCTEKATIFCATGMAAFITSMVALIIKNEMVPKFVEMDFARVSVTAAA